MSMYKNRENTPKHLFIISIDLLELLFYNIGTITNILMGGENMTQDEFIKKYSNLSHNQKLAIEELISSFQTAQTFRPQGDVALAKDGYILNTEQLLPFEDYPHQKDN